MPLITFTSDFGLTDHYTAAVKAKLYSGIPSLQVIDISHEIDNFNIAHASFVLRSIYRDFPDNSIHLIAVGSSSASEDCIAVHLDNHYFLSSDNGIISLLTEREPDRIIKLEYLKPTNFVARDILAPAAVAIANGKELTEMGTKVSEMQRKLPRQLKANKRLIAGNVIHVDHYGNLITNIDRFTFEVLSKNSDFEVIFGRERFDSIHDTYYDVDYGECVLFFNSLQLLEISINQGSAAQLLGLQYDSPVQILFDKNS